MDYLIKLNAASVTNRQIDTLIGLCKGVLADGKVCQAEAEFLQNWLIQNPATQDHPLFKKLLPVLSDFLGKGVLNDHDAEQLKQMLTALVGESSLLGEVLKPSSLPLDQAPVFSPQHSALPFANLRFVLTGKFSYGSRAMCEDATQRLGGKCTKSVSMATDFVVLGNYVSESWKHESFGRKIEQAMDYRDNKGAKLKIIKEDEWVAMGSLQHESAE